MNMLVLLVLVEFLNNLSSPIHCLFNIQICHYCVFLPIFDSHHGHCLDNWTPWTDTEYIIIFSRINTSPIHLCMSFHDVFYIIEYLYCFLFYNVTKLITSFFLDFLVLIRIFLQTYFSITVGSVHGETWLLYRCWSFTIYTNHKNLTYKMFNNLHVV